LTIFHISYSSLTPPIRTPRDPGRSPTQATLALLRIGPLAERVWRPGAFAATLARVMAARGRRRNLLARIRRSGWPEGRFMALGANRHFAKALVD